MRALHSASWAEGQGPTASRKEQHHGHLDLGLAAHLPLLPASALCPQSSEPSPSSPESH